MKEWFLHIHANLLDSKYTFLLFTLIALIMLPPYVGDGFVGKMLNLFLITLILVAALIALPKRKHLIITFIVLAVISTFSSVLSVYFDRVVASIIDNATTSIYLFAAIVIFTKDVLGSKKVTRDTMYGSICIYLLIGVTYGLIYGLVEVVHPGSFKIIIQPNTAAFQGIDFYYFSFITLTTVGYGDIAILTPYAKSVVILESITGIFYLAILVARLVALGTNGNNNGQHKKNQA